MGDATALPHGFCATCHPACIACRPTAEGGLGLRFQGGEGGAVQASFSSDARYQGYPDRLHGGIVATLMDAAMTHCLFARSILAYTVKMSVRYQRPAQVGDRCVIRAELLRSRGPLHFLRAEVRQNGEVCATAEATFMAPARVGAAGR